MKIFKRKKKIRKTASLRCFRGRESYVANGNALNWVNMRDDVEIINFESLVETNKDIIEEHGKYIVDVWYYC